MQQGCVCTQHAFPWLSAMFELEQHNAHGGLGYNGTHEAMKDMVGKIHPGIRGRAESQVAFHRAKCLAAACLLEQYLSITLY